MKILICGLPGSGKTTLSRKLCSTLNIPHVNADAVRQHFNDWDFSEAGRLRQAKRMSALCENNPLVIADFVCPTKETHQLFGADFTIWMNTIQQGRFQDTNKIYIPPETPDLTITRFDDSFELALSAINHKYHDLLPIQRSWHLNETSQSTKAKAGN